MAGKLKTINVGDEFTLNNGLTVTVSEYVNSNNVTVTDGNTFKRTSADSLRKGQVRFLIGVEEYKPRKSICQIKSIQIGDKFDLNCGITVEVVEYIDATKIVVTDGKDQYKTASAASLRRGTVSFLVDGKRKTGHSNKMFAPVEINVGCVFQSNCWGDVVVTDLLPDGRFIINFVNTGYVSNVCRTALLSGEIRDKTAFVLNITKKFKPGMEFKSPKYGNYKILSVVNCNEIHVQWEDTGEVIVTKSDRIRDNSVSDKTRAYNRADYLKPKGYYVYLAKYNDEICYVGFGKGTRYTHCNSGTSSSYHLNRLHFEGKVFEIEIYEDGLIKEAAMALEKETILKFKPSCNVANTSTFRNKTQ